MITNLWYGTGLTLILAVLLAFLTCLSQEGCL